MIEFLPLTEEFLFSVEAAEREIFSDPWSLEAISSHLALPYEKSLIAQDGGRLCGYLLATVIDGEGEVLRIATLPRHRRRGVGKKLLSLFLSETRTAFLEVRSQNTAARALYETLGFLPVGTRKNYYKAPSDDAILYSLK